jgi:hypothetical protein
MNKTAWTSEEDNLFRELADMQIAPEIIATKMDRSVQALKTRAYTLGLPRKWFKRKPENALG